jgi:hypothetical protein
MHASVMMAMPVIAIPFGRSTCSPSPQLVIVRSTAGGETELDGSSGGSQLAFMAGFDRERGDDADRAREPCGDRHRGEADHQKHGTGREQHEDGGIVPPVDRVELRELLVECGVVPEQLALDVLDPVVELVDVYVFFSFFWGMGG